MFQNAYVLSWAFRGVGCIYYEMVTGRPLFAGQNVQEQLHHIFKKRGTPTEDNWPGISSNSKFLEYRSVNIQSFLIKKTFSFKQYKPESLESIAPRLDHYGRELLLGFLKVAKITLK